MYLCRSLLVAYVFDVYRFVLACCACVVVLFAYVSVFQYNFCLIGLRAFLVVVGFANLSDRMYVVWLACVVVFVCVCLLIMCLF